MHVKYCVPVDVVLMLPWHTRGDVRSICAVAEATEKTSYGEPPKLEPRIVSVLPTVIALGVKREIVGPLPQRASERDQSGWPEMLTCSDCG